VVEVYFMIREIVKRRTHFVPRCYLKNFTFDNKQKFLFAYTRDGEVKEVSIADIAVKKNFYTFTDKITKKKTDIAENMFAILEKSACPVITKIIKTQNLSLNEKERGALSQFIAFLATRTLAFDIWQRNMSIEMLKQLMVERAKNKNHLKTSFEKVGIKFGNERELEDMRQSILDFDKHFKVELKGGRGDFFKTSVQLAMDLTPIIFYKHWHLLVNNGSRVFITSDNPVPRQKARNVPSMFNSGFAFGTVIFPLSPTLCLLMRHEPLSNEIITVNRSQGEAINRSIMLFSEKFIYSNINSQDLKRMYKNIPESSATKVIVKRIKNTPYIMATSPELDWEIIG